MNDYKKLRIWQKALEISLNCYKIIKNFPSQEKFGLASQISRSGVSIPSNIAEGSSRTSVKDYNKFIEIAIGSLFELGTQLMIAQKLNYGNQELIRTTLIQVEQLGKMMNVFSQKLKLAMNQLPP